jgi:CMP-N-acetylneuraminic acid synthetase
MAVTNFPLPAYQAMYYLPEDKVIPLLPDLIDKRESDLNEIVVNNGSTYVSTVNAFRKSKKLLISNMRGYKMDIMRSIDIDEESDYELAKHYAGVIKANYTL